MFSFSNRFIDNNPNSLANEAKKRRRKSKRTLRIEELENREMLDAGLVGLIHDHYNGEFELSGWEQANFIQVGGERHVGVHQDNWFTFSEEGLRSAIALAGETEGDDIIVVFTGGTQSTNTITLGGEEIAINIHYITHGSVTIVSLGAENLTIDAGGQSRVFNIGSWNTSTNVTIAGLTVTNGDVTGNEAGDDFGGGILLGGWGDLMVSHSTFTNNVARSGGAIGTEWYYGDITIAYSLFEDNSVIFNQLGGSDFFGGGAVFSTGDVAIDKSKFINNSVSGGVGGAIRANSATIIDSEFNGNFADGRNGGAVHVREDAEIVNSNFRDNYTGIFSSGGIIGGGAIRAGGTLTINGGVFERNLAGVNPEDPTDLRGAGGAISASVATIEGARFVENFAAGGGAITAGILSVKDSVFERNSADSGGAITAGSLFVDVSVFKSNEATGRGGAIDARSATIKDSTFENNSTIWWGNFGPGLTIVGLGGAIYSGNLVIEDSKFVGNEANGRGGAVFVEDTLEIKGQRSEFKDNTAGFSGGAIVVEGTATIEGTTFVGNRTTLTTQIIINFQGERAILGGGAIWAGDELTVEDSTFKSNTSLIGSHNGTIALGVDGKLTLINCVLDPDTPKNVKVTSSAETPRTLTVSWDKVDSVTLAGYRIEYSTNQNFTGSQSVEVGADKTSVELTNLTTGQLYHVRVIALGNKSEGFADSLPSERIIGRPGMAQASYPLNEKITSIPGGRSVTFTIAMKDLIDALGGSASHDDLFRLNLSINGNTWSKVRINSPEGDPIASITAYGLEPETEYEFQLLFGSYVLAEMSIKTTEMLMQVTPGPRSVTLTVLAGDLGEYLHGLGLLTEIRFRSDPTQEWQTAGILNQSIDWVGNYVIATIRGLDENTTYFFQWTAEWGEVVILEATATTGDPNAGPKLEHTATNTSVTLTGLTAGRFYIIQYGVERGTESKPRAPSTWMTWSNDSVFGHYLVGNTGTVTIDSLTAGTRYQFRVLEVRYSEGRTTAVRTAWSNILRAKTTGSLLVLRDADNRLNNARTANVANRVDNTTNSVNVSWGSVAHINTYIITYTMPSGIRGVPGTVVQEVVRAIREGEGTNVDANSVLTHTITGLRQNTSYRFSIVGVNENGNATRAVTVTQRTDRAETWRAPSGLRTEQGTRPTINSVKLAWNSVLNADKYIVQVWSSATRTSAAALVQNITIERVGNAPPETTLEVKNLIAGTRYIFAVQAVKDTGTDAEKFETAFASRAISTARYPAPQLSLLRQTNNVTIPNFNSATNMRNGLSAANYTHYELFWVDSNRNEWLIGTHSLNPAPAQPGRVTITLGMMMPSMYFDVFYEEFQKLTKQRVNFVLKAVTKDGSGNTVNWSAGNRFGTRADWLGDPMAW